MALSDHAVEYLCLLSSLKTDDGSSGDDDNDDKILSLADDDKMAPSLFHPSLYLASPPCR
jgi:hypothetical protein